MSYHFMTNSNKKYLIQMHHFWLSKKMGTQYFMCVRYAITLRRIKIRMGSKFASPGMSDQRYLNDYRLFSQHTKRFIIVGSASGYLKQ